jgi:hypothetical protein
MDVNQTHNRILARLLDTFSIMKRVVYKTVTRGLELTELERKSSEVLETSQLFMFKTIPWYKRAYHRLKKVLCICPSWWCRCGGDKKENKSESRKLFDI